VVRIQLNDAGSVFPAGHKVWLALSTAYNARTKSVVAIGIALLLKTSYDDPTPAASIGYSFVDTVSSGQSRPSMDAASSLA
jgi:hypothetical protein